MVCLGWVVICKNVIVVWVGTHNYCCEDSFMILFGFNVVVCLLKKIVKILVLEETFFVVVGNIRGPGPSWAHLSIPDVIFLLYLLPVYQSFL